MGPEAAKFAARGRIIALDYVLVIAVTLGLGLRTTFVPSMSQDEISAVLYSELVSQGSIPHRDFFTPYGPAPYWLLAAVFKILGEPSIYASRVLALALHAFIAVSVYTWSRSRGRFSAVLAGSICGILSAMLEPVPYAWLLAVGSAVFALAVADRHPVLAGGLLALATSARPEFAVVGLITTCLLARRATAARWLAGWLLGSIPLAWHVVLARENFVANVLTDRLLVDARLPWSRVGPTELLLLGIVLLSAVGLLTNAVATRSRSDLAVGALGLLLVPQAVQRLDVEHLALVGLVVVPLAAASVLSRAARVSTSIPIEPLVRRSAIPSMLLLTSLGIVVGLASPRASVVAIEGRTLLTPNKNVARLVQREVAAIERAVPSGADVFIGSTDMSRSAVTPTYLYYLMPDRVPDAYFLELAPGVAERPGSPLLDDVSRQSHLLLSEMSSTQRKALFPHIPRGSSRVDRYVRRRFCLVRELDSVRILERCPT